MILTSNGLILTNNHVIEGSTSITARDIATGKTYTAKVVGYDIAKDIAVLQLENASGLTTVSLGNSSKVKADEQVVGIGNAGGVGGTPSYVAGTIVATDQSITANSEENPNGSESLSGLIETNAPIEPGDPAVRWSRRAAKSSAWTPPRRREVGGFGFGYSQATTATQAYTIPINTALAIAKAIEHGDDQHGRHRRDGDPRDRSGARQTPARSVPPPVRRDDERRHGWYRHGEYPSGEFGTGGG